MANQLLAQPIALNDSYGLRYAKLGAWYQQALANAGVGYSPTGLLAPIDIGDSDGVRFAKLGAMLTLLANNIGGGGGGTPISGVKGSVAIPSGVDTVALTFSGLTAAPTAIILTVGMPNANALVLNATYDKSSKTAAGVTVWLSAYTDQTGYTLDYLAIP